MKPTIFVIQKQECANSEPVIMQQFGYFTGFQRAVNKSRELNESRDEIYSVTQINNSPEDK